MVWRAASLVGDESGQDLIEYGLRGEEANSPGRPSTKLPPGRWPRRLTQLVIGSVTLLVLLIGGLIGGVFYFTRDSSSATTAELRRPLPASALNMTGLIGALTPARDLSPFVSTLRRSSDKVGLIRFRGHLLKGGYDVHDGATKQEPTTPSAV